MNEKIFNTGRISINYVESGTGDITILLLHGGSSRLQTFKDLIPELAGKYHVYAIDLRGHGKTDRVSGQYKIQDYVTDVKEFIEMRIQKQVIVFGHSLGGMIAELLAAYYPKIVKAIIIGDSPISLGVLKKHSDDQKEMTMLWREWSRTMNVEEIAEELKRMQVAIPGEDNTVPAYEVFGKNHPWFDFMAESLKQNDPDMLTSIIDRFDETYSAYNIDRIFLQIKCPVLIIKGEEKHGSLIRNIDISHAQTLIGNLKYIEIKGVGHALYMQNLEAVVKAIIEFVDEYSKA
ncbi:MAG: alpha/beta hydrolase fold protein [Anaerosolibacter sp.]|jgi:pimeloyl-ACP methyl ester carboxylesterase|uniref:alpha/beta fold hydrolase n=1 Tax=Anaerosolibacter sp. TaxID=1872527 RepID=UPI0026155A6E|nr:alpha/beta hydrolase [Anaerosolibacter sp.]MDF2546335.1 alpha/beta hydrolase fold protein [Anaerosolibacter sp.]